MTYSFAAVAKLELQDAIDHYELAQDGLGAEFAAEVKEAVAGILAHPEAWPSMGQRSPVFANQAVPLRAYLHHSR